MRAEFDFWVGLVMDKFYDGLQNKQFIGTKCSKCGKVFLPPRNRCGDCFAKAEEFVDLPQTGVVKNFTVSNWNVTERRIRKAKEPNMVGLIQIDGTDTAMVTPILNANPNDLKESVKTAKHQVDLPNMEEVFIHYTKIIPNRIGEDNGKIREENLV